MAVREDQITAFIDRYYERFMAKHMKIEPPFNLVSEYTLPNGQQVDKVIMGTNNKILALIECKGEVNLNEFVRGTGQAIQGAYQIIKNNKGDFSEDAKSFLVVPIEMDKNVKLDLFDYHNFTLIFADINNDITIQYDENNYASTKADEWVTVNPYYFRDCSLEGIYFYLQLIMKNLGLRKKLSLSQMEDKVKKERGKLGINFFGDVRNNHIIPSVVGFYNESDRILTSKGYEFARKKFPEFCRAMVVNEFGEYSRAVMIAIISLINNQKQDKDGYYDIKTDKIAEFIKTVYEGKKVTYLFDPDGGSRNLTTVIRMLATVAAIDRKGQKMKINYLPFDGMPFLMEKHTGKCPSDAMRKWFDAFELPF